MRKFVTAAFAVIVTAGAAGACEVEDWRWTYTAMMNALQIEGVTTCAKGEMSVRIYDGEGENRKFLAVDTAYIERHIFQSIVTGIERKPANLTIKYTIDAE
ncbi:MAG: hypothetical protein OXI22_14980 [Defluviicoccus sp.]|nr:hypothetical protein [Defluviicoccus sp.]MDE0385185.1 hypothetical protein [Defluviicoccus sp.]